MLEEAKRLSIISLALVLLGVPLLFFFPPVLGTPGITDMTDYSTANFLVFIGRGLFMLTISFVLFMWVVYFDQKRKKI